MSAPRYNWEENGRKHKAIKTSGTVIFNPNDHVNPSFEACKDLSAATRDVLTATLGFKEFMPAQAQCFKGITNGRDVILHSRTGSGKTLAYTLPLVERFLRERAGLDEATRRMQVPAAPYIVVFVFGNELAVQTKTVINSVYGNRVAVAVAGFDEVTSETPVDVLIGTLSSVDHLLRGAAARGGDRRDPEDDDEQEVDSDGSADSEEVEEEEDEGLVAVDDANNAAGPSAPGQRRPREHADGFKHKLQHRAEYADTLGVVSLARVRAVVVDEVDATLGPKFTKIGRRFKNLIKAIRKGNGSLTKGLTADYRMHHYVLCGATIPNWVLKAGFLGIKKYYYRLVTAGDAKLPQQLECYTYCCPKRERISTTARLVLNANFGRTVIFTTGHRIAMLETAIKAAIAEAQAAAAAAAPAAPAKRSSKAAAQQQTQQPQKEKPIPSLRTLSAEKDEQERIACIADFNSGAANVLLCTDSAARGLDFVAVDTVLMETLPEYMGSQDTFVHRAGRTARVTSAGRTVLLHDPTLDSRRLAALESVLHVSFKDFPKVDGTAAPSTARLSLRVRQTLQAPRSMAAATPVATPRSVLQSAVDAALIIAVHDTADADRIEFEVPADAREVARKALWKYDVKVVQ